MWNRANDHLRFLSRLTPVPCREHLAEMAQNHFNPGNLTGNAVEVGVKEGLFSAHNLNWWQGQYYGVDAWATASRLPGCSGRERAACNNFHDARAVDHRYDLARRHTKPWTHRVTLLRALSTDAAASFQDGFFDWIYIDALHTYDAVSEDLRAWWPKLREGGLFSGDDYGDKERTEYLTTDEAQSNYDSRYPYVKAFHWGVIRAVNQFAREVGAPVQVSWHAHVPGTAASPRGTWLNRTLSLSVPVLVHHCACAPAVVPVRDLAFFFSSFTQGK